MIVPDTMTAFFDALKSANLGGNLCTDALITALALEDGARVFTNDRDFQRFAGLDGVNPD
jgi:predicted nucleic acid-binding protein